ncbi:hypothetical protein BDW75DRAFT_136017 [Aspergillus navahoensis]
MTKISHVIHSSRSRAIERIVSSSMLSSPPTWMKIVLVPSSMKRRMMPCEACSTQLIIDLDQSRLTKPLQDEWTLTKPPLISGCSIIFPRNRVTRAQQTPRTWMGSAVLLDHRTRWSARNELAGRLAKEAAGLYLKVSQMWHRQSNSAGNPLLENVHIRYPFISCKRSK